MLPPLLDRASRAAAALPHGFDPGLARVSGTVWSLLDGRRRSAVVANRAALRARFGVDRPFAASVEALLSWLRLVRAGAPEVAGRTAFEGLEGEGGVRAACARSGAVLVAAHVGFWEWGAAALAAAGLPVVAVSGIQMHERWSPALVSAKRRLGIEIVGPDAPARALLEPLRRGALVALLVDGDVVTARAPQSLAGRSVALPKGPGLLAARAGVPIFAGRCERDRTAGAGRFRVRLTRLFDPTRDIAELPDFARDAKVARAADFANERVAAWLGETLLEDPSRWCLFREFFPREGTL